MQKRAEVTGAALLRAAAAVFIRAGYAHARLNTIITEAHVSKGALYDHFGSKEELARAVIAAGSTRFKSACDPFLTSGIPAVEALIGISCLLLDPAVNDTMVQATFRLITDVGDRPATGTTLLGTCCPTTNTSSAAPSPKATFARKTPTPSLTSWWKPSPGSTSWSRPPAAPTICPPN